MKRGLLSLSETPSAVRVLRKKVRGVGANSGAPLHLSGTRSTETISADTLDHKGARFAPAMQDADQTASLPADDVGNALVDAVGSLVVDEGPHEVLGRWFENEVIESYMDDECEDVQGLDGSGRT